jgi:hypothetical protein
MILLSTVGKEDLDPWNFRPFIAKIRNLGDIADKLSGALRGVSLNPGLA